MNYVNILLIVAFVLALIAALVAFCYIVYFGTCAVIRIKEKIQEHCKKQETENEEE